MDSSLIPNITQGDDDRPLPLIVAERWGFRLTYVLEDGIYWYSITDWIGGLSETTIPGDIWRKMRKKPDMASIQDILRTYPYGTSKSQFTTDKGLYRITIGMIITKYRPNLAEIRDYLAKAGAFVDVMRRDPQLRAKIGATAGADEVIDATIERYQKGGKEANWIQARLEGIVTRKQFTSALRAAVLYASGDLYRNGTEKIYSGLWKRTTAQLRSELGIKRKDNPRDHMSEYALIYTRLAEKVATDKLRHAEIVTESLAMEIVFTAAKMIRQQALATAQALGQDLLTGKPLLQSGISRDEFHQALEKVSRPNKQSSDED
jgi:hypothetical protein